MSQSPITAISNGVESANKKRRLDSGSDDMMSTGEGSSGLQQAGQQHIPKRGARACTNCRKGKNRCEGEVSSSCCGPNRPARSHLARLPRPGPARRRAGPASMQALRRERVTVYLRKTREEKCAKHGGAQR